MVGTPFIKTIRINDRQTVELSSNSVLALVGANNAGKTYFLNLLRSHIHGATVQEISPNTDLFHAIEIGWRGTVNDAETVIQKRVQSVFTLTDHGYRNNNRIKYPGGSSIRDGSFPQIKNGTSSLGVYTDLFLEFDSAIERINETELQRQIRPSSSSDKESLTQLAYESVNASNSIKSYFRRIFHHEISYYERHGDLGFLLTAEQENGSPAGQALSQATKDHMDTSPKLWLQGLGMRSVLGLLLRIFASEKEIIIIDEPEAFLHPPQAAALGGVLAQISALQNKQIILATHDRNLLNGLLKNSNNSVSIQRISRISQKSHIECIEPETLSSVRNMSLIRYSTIFDSIFTRMTVLVENEKDAFFYSEVLEHILINDPENYPNISIDDILFISTSGTGAIRRTAELVSSLGSRVVVACDLDLLADRTQFFGVVNAVSAATPELREAYEQLLNSMFKGGKASKETKEKEFKRCRGLDSEDSSLSKQFSDLFQKLDDLRVILHPLGELEDFAPQLTQPKGKAEWAQTAIQENVHESEAARTFGKRILRHLLH